MVRPPSTSTLSARGFARSGTKRKSSAGSHQSTNAVSRPSRPSTNAEPAKRFTMRLPQAPGQRAVDEDHGAADIRGALRAEERREVPDLARRSEPPERDRREIRLGRPVRIDLADSIGVDPPRRDAVDGDPL